MSKAASKNTRPERASTGDSEGRTPCDPDDVMGPWS